jgi:hypothetical protein
MENKQDYQKTLLVKTTPTLLFDAITKHIDKWWSENYQGVARSKDDEFTVTFGATFKTIRISFVEENKKVSWLCIDQYIEMPPGISPLKNKREWVGQTITWEIEADGKGSILKHMHIGLTPQVECWGVCETGWDQTLKSLTSFLETGKGMPFEQLDKEHLDRALEHQRKRHITENSL